jgi:hypothetical protein
MKSVIQHPVRPDKNLHSTPAPGDGLVLLWPLLQPLPNCTGRAHSSRPCATLVSSSKLHLVFLHDGLQQFITDQSCRDAKDLMTAGSHSLEGAVPLSALPFSCRQRLA